MDYPKFDGLNVSSKFAICGLPVRVDSYKTCSFGCKYCFANGRKIMEFKKNLQVADTDSIERRLSRIYNGGGKSATSWKPSWSKRSHGTLAACPTRSNP